MTITDEELKSRFNSPQENITPRQREVIGLLGEHAMATATLIRDLTPCCREQSLALTHLEDMIHWSNLAVLRNSPA